MNKQTQVVYCKLQGVEILDGMVPSPLEGDMVLCSIACNVSLCATWQQKKAQIQRRNPPTFRSMRE